MSQLLPINENKRWERVEASAGQTALTVPFPFQKNDDVAVFRFRAGAKVRLVLNADYTLTGVGNPLGGTITLAVPALALDRYLLIGAAALERLTSIVRAGRFSSEAIDDDFDRLLLIAQEFNRDISRSLLAPLGEAGQELPARIDLAGSALAFDDDGNAIAGPRVAELINAQGYAEDAYDAAQAASDAADRAEDVLANIIIGIVPNNSISEAKLTADVSARLNLLRRLPSLQHLNARMAAGQTVKIACYGDSTTDGNNTSGWIRNVTDAAGDAVGVDHNIDAPNSWPVKMQAILREMYSNQNIHVYNAGYSGKRLDNGWARNNYSRAILNNSFYGKCDAVLIAFGLNDITVTNRNTLLANTRNETISLCSQIAQDGTIPVLVTCDAFWMGKLWSDNRDYVDASRIINETKHSLAKEMGIACLDMERAITDWWNYNEDGYSTRVTQMDALHVGNDGHKFKASFVASELFSGISRVEYGIMRTAPADARGNSKTGTGAFYNTLSGTRSNLSNRMVGNFSGWTAGLPVVDMWVWNENPEAMLYYRTNYSGGRAPTNTLSSIVVKDYVSEAEFINVITPSEGENWTPTYGFTERPILVDTLKYGLNRIQLRAPTPDATSFLWGYFEVNPNTGLNYTRRNLGVNLLQKSGPRICTNADLPAGPSVIVEKERADLSNVVSRQSKSGSVVVRAKLRLTRRAGLVFHAGVTSTVVSGDHQPNRSGGMLIFPTSDATCQLYAYRVTIEGVTLFAAVPSSVFNFPVNSENTLAMVFDRDGSGVPRLRIYSDYSLSTILLTVANLAGELHLPQSGVFGGVYFQGNAAEFPNQEFRLLEAFVEYNTP